MAYLGNDLQVAFPSYRLIDDISASFNGVLTTFALTIGGASPVPFPINPQQCLISVNGTIQKPDPTGTAGFTLTGTNIVFASAPTGGWAFFGVILAGADYVNIGANFPDGQVNAPSITFDQDTDTGFYRSGSGAVSFTSNGVGTATFGSASFIAPSFIPTSSTVPTNGVYLPAANSVAISTNAVERVEFGTSEVVFNDGGANYDFRIEGDTNANLFFVDASTDRVGLGTSSPGETLDVLGNIRSYSSQFQLNKPADFAGLIVSHGTYLDNTTKGGVLLRGGHGDGGSLNAWAIYARRDSTGGSTAAATLTFAHVTQNTGAETPRMTIDQSGRVGIGTTIPARLLHLKEDNSGRSTLIRFENKSLSGGVSTQQIAIEGIFDYNNGASTAGAGNIVFGKEDTYTSALTAIKSYIGFETINNNSITEKARIDSSGRLLVGTSTARSSSAVTPRYFQEGVSTYEALGVCSNGGTVANRGAYLFLNRSRGTSLGSSTVVASGDTIGGINFHGADGTDLETAAAYINCEVDGTPGANDMPGRLVFSTTADGASSPTERLRITSAGVLQVADAGNITVGTTTGTKIGTATTQKIGFYNATPVVQPTAVADATTAVDVITQLNALLAKLRTLGIIAT